MTKEGQREKAGHNLKVTTLTMSLKQEQTKVRCVVTTFAFPTTRQGNTSRIILTLRVTSDPATTIDQQQSLFSCETGGLESAKTMPLGGASVGGAAGSPLPCSTS